MAIVERPVGRQGKLIVAGRRSAVLDELGGPPLEVRHLAECDRAPGYLLSHECRVICGSLDRSGLAGSYTLQPHRAAWRSLRDVSEELLTHTVGRVQRAYPNWTLPGSSRDAIHDRVRAFLEGATS